MRAVHLDSCGTLAIGYCFVFPLWLVPSTSSTTAVTVVSENLTCWSPEKLVWSLTCKVTIHEDAPYITSIQVKALDQFESPSVIARCSRGTYLFSSFAQFMGQSGTRCPLPAEQNQKKTFRVPFSFTNVAANSDGRLSFPIQNISCGALVYLSDKYELFSEQLTHDLIPCVKPTMELPSTFYFIDGNVAVVNCSAWNAVPEAQVLLAITSTSNQSSYLHSATGVNSSEIVINASSKYHRATVNCTVLNHAHYLAPKMSEILVYHISRKASENESLPLAAICDDVLNCSERVDSYPEAEFKWFMDDAFMGNQSSLSVPCCSAVKLHCVAVNSAANASVHIAYTFACKDRVANLLLLLLLLLLTLIIFFVVICVRCVPRARNARQEFRHILRFLLVRRQRGQHREARGSTPAASSAGGSTELHQRAPLNDGAPWSQDDA